MRALMGVQSKTLHTHALRRLVGGWVGGKTMRRICVLYGAKKLRPTVAVRCVQTEPLHATRGRPPCVSRSLARSSSSWLPHHNAFFFVL
jgi:hypothetical protein